MSAPEILTRSPARNKQKARELDKERDKDRERDKEKDRKLKATQKATQTDRLKVVVRRLPPNLPEDVFWKSVEQWVTDETVVWKAFYGGKAKKRYEIAWSVSSSAIDFAGQNQ